MKPPSLKKKKKPVRRRKSRKGGRRLTQLLTEMGGDSLMADDGGVTTRDEALAGLIWDMALGRLPTGKDEQGNVIHAKPNEKMALAILERREGKTPAAMPDKTNELSVADRIDALDRNVVNSDADALDSVPGHTEDLDVPGNGD